MKVDIKIFFEDRFIVLTDDWADVGAGFTPAHPNNAPTYYFENKKMLAKRLERFEKSDEKCLYIIHDDLNKLFVNVKNCFKYIEAAGGIVTLPDGRVLCIKRFGKWDLPKGKVDKGETHEETAIREVVEECGLEKTPQITGELMPTFHTYKENGKNILKYTIWYAMHYDGNETLKPQTDEDITRAAWFPPNLLNVVRQNTYQSINQVLNTQT